jgi:TRAP-type C4-dicarboxylate transport system substrate-binding protein
MTNAIGSLVVSQRFYNQLPKDLQQLLKTTGKKIAEQINQDSRRDNAKSIELLKQSGIEFSWDWNQAEKQQMLQIRDRAAELLNASGYIPEAHFTRVKNILSDYRSSQPGQ